VGSYAQQSLTREGFYYGLGKDKPDYRVKGLLQGGSLPAILLPVVAKLIEHQGKPHLAFAIQSTGIRSTHQYWQLIKELTGYRGQFLGTLDDGHLDTLICPPHALPALAHGSGDLLTVYSAASYAVLYNVLGMPTGVVVATRVREGEESARAPVASFGVMYNPLRLVERRDPETPDTIDINGENTII